MNDNKIDEQFTTIDDAIVNNREIVPDLFVQLKSSINELEEKCNVYRYQLHLKKASYLKAVGNLDEWQKEEILMNKYFAICQQQQINNQGTQMTEQTPISPMICDVQTDASIQIEIESCLKNLKSFFNNERIVFYKELESIVIQFTKSSVNSLNEYIELDLIYSSIHSTLNILQIQTQTDSEAVEGQNENSFLALLTSLNLYLFILQYQRKVDFVQFILTQRSELRSILFANIPLTEERIQSHAKKLSALFHLDNCEIEHKAIFAEFFQLIAEDTSKQLEELTNRKNRPSLVEYYKARGREYLDVAVDYEYARKKEWTKVDQLKRETLRSLTDGELENHQYFYAMSAYEQYRAAARELEAAETSKTFIGEKVELKKCMANSLYISGASRILEAQIYAIAGIHLIVTSDNILRCKDDLEELEKLLQKIHSANVPFFQGGNSMGIHELIESIKFRGHIETPHSNNPGFNKSRDCAGLPFAPCIVRGFSRRYRRSKR